MGGSVRLSTQLTHSGLISRQLVGEHGEDTLVLLEDDPHQDDLGALTHEGGGESLVETTDTLSPPGTRETVPVRTVALKGGAVRRGGTGLHHPGLDDIERVHDQGAHRTRHGACDEVGLDTVRVAPLEEGPLCDVVGGELARGHEAAAEHQRAEPAVELPDTLLLGDGAEPVEHGLVTTLLVLREATVGLHANEDHVSGAAEGGCHRPRDPRGENLASDTDVGAFAGLAQSRLHRVVDTETGGREEGLAEPRRGDATVEPLLETLVTVDVLDDLHTNPGALPRLALAMQEHANLQGVRRVSQSASGHRRQPANSRCRDRHLGK
eukprot:Hpha_TRINITY_DN16018_c4_g6::TRINITY_DN16018_c4_g6_i1::g.118221::m.118221